VVKNINLQEQNFSYKIIGKRDKPVLLLLHGWGGSFDSFTPLEGFLSLKYRLIIPALPMFKKEDITPKCAFSLCDYVLLVERILEQENVSCCFVIAHSFGARVAVKLNINNPKLFRRVCIVGGAGLKPKFNLRVWLKIRLYKLMKRFFLHRNCGSADYQLLNEQGKKTFVNILKTDLKQEIRLLNAPTLIIVGECDAATPIYMAKRWKKLCGCATLLVYKDCGHFAYLDNTAKFLNDAVKFFNLEAKND
jgi:pimeloyl-ACP methyl ester carboxylesterase